MRWGVLGTVALVALAGCSGASPYSAGNSTTVTPASVPEDPDSATASDVAGFENGTIDSGRLAARHAASLTGTYTRLVFLTVRVDGERRFGYRSMETHGLATNESIRTRRYLGPDLERFVPVSGNVSTVTERRYRASSQESRRRVVAGNATVIRGDDPPPLQSPFPTTRDERLVAGFLRNATVVEQTAIGSDRLRGHDVSTAVVPDQLDAPENATVDAVLRPNGRLRYVAAQYTASFRGERATVRVDVYWSPPTEPFLTPTWLEPE